MKKKKKFLTSHFNLYWSWNFPWEKKREMIRWKNIHHVCLLFPPVRVEIYLAFVISSFSPFLYVYILYISIMIDSRRSFFPWTRKKSNKILSGIFGKKKKFHYCFTLHWSRHEPRDFFPLPLIFFPVRFSIIMYTVYTDIVKTTHLKRKKKLGEKNKNFRSQVF